MLHRFSILTFKIIALSIVMSFFSTISLHAYKKNPGHLQIKKSGDMGQFVVPIIAAIIPLMKQDHHALLEYASSWSATMGATYILKPLINTPRPISGGMSFPSGHTAAAMGGAAFLQMHYGPYWGIPAYLAAGYVGFSRVYAQKHWVRDVVGATVIAMAANYFFSKDKPVNYRVAPLWENDRAGITVQWEW